MPGARGCGDELEGHLDHRVVGHRAGQQPAIEQQVFGLEQVGAGRHAPGRRHLHPNDDAFRRHRQPVQFHLGATPVGGEVHQPARLGDIERADELRGEDGGLEQPRGDVQAFGLHRQRRTVGIERDAGADAVELEAERKAGDALITAAIDAAGLGLARSPALDGSLGHARAIGPERRPTTAAEHKQRQQDQRPASSARRRTTLSHIRCEAIEYGVSKVCIFSPRIAPVQPVAKPGSA